MKKDIEKYTTIFYDALRRKNIKDAEEVTRRYTKKLNQMYHSEQFKSHNVYPSLDTKKIYAVIAMCLILKDMQFEKDQIIDFVNDTFRKPQKLVRILSNIIDVFPWAYRFVEKYHITGHNKALQDGSITYELFQVDYGRIEYRISKCMYLEMFRYYGIRELCKVFCLTDGQVYSGMHKHVKFTRYSDLADGDICHDVITRKS